MIGLSLSLCVANIITGHVKESDVQLIIAGTKADNGVAMHEVLHQYADNYWYTAPEEGLAVARRFLKAGRIFQPRIYNYEYNCNIADGHWLKRDENGPDGGLPVWFQYKFSGWNR
jgi:hypothetical protein